MFTVKAYELCRLFMKTLLGQKKYSKFHKSNEICTLDEYIGQVEEVLSERLLKPLNTSPHIGLELEFIGPRDLLVDFMFKISQKKLHNNVVLTYDGTIEGFDDNVEAGYELKLIETENNICSLVKKCLDMLSWYDNLRINDSCGLHIHIDCRYLNRKDVYDKFYSNKDSLYKLAPKSRRNNKYCMYPIEINYNIGDHTKGIELSRKGTVEIRLQQASFNKNKIINWIKVLTSIKNYGRIIK